MIQIILENLKKVDSPLATTLLDIATDNLEVVQDSFYTSTVFESKDNYKKNSFQLSNAYQSCFNESLAKTDLAFVRGQGGPVFLAKPGKGMVTGVVLFHYVTKEPLLLVVVDKSSSSYVYQSVKYNTETKKFNALSNKSIGATTIKELTTFISDNLTSDIKTFKV